jgi:hypothetical protein
MFPNLRLMVVAVLASILGISCALGLFAEFRVSHDSFLRESNATTPLQLGSSDEATGRVVNTAAPFEFRFQAPAPSAPTADETIDQPETPEHTAVVETPRPAPPPPKPETATTSGASAAAVASDLTSTAETAAVPASSGHAAEAPSPAATGSIADQASPQEVPSDSQQKAKPETEGTLAARTPAVSPSVGTSLPNGQIAPAATQTAVPRQRKRTTLRHRPIILRRAQRTWPAATQNFTSQPTFQWMPQYPPLSPQPARRRIIKRVRPARKPVVQTTSPQTAVADPPPADTPE